MESSCCHLHDEYKVFPERCIYRDQRGHLSTPFYDLIIISLFFLHSFLALSTFVFTFFHPLFHVCLLNLLFRTPIFLLTPLPLPLLNPFFPSSPMLLLEHSNLVHYINFFFCVCEKKKARDTDRETGRQTDSDTETGA